MNDNQHNEPMGDNDDLTKGLDEGGLQFEETPVNGDQNDNQNSHDSSAPSMDPMSAPSDTADPYDEPAKDEESSKPADEPKGDTSDLDALKASALDDLRPLVGKLGLNPKEKFDTLLLIIRSTDDQNMLKEAHETAKSITDDTERAQALLEVIKEVDYFKNK